MCVPEFYFRMNLALSDSEIPVNSLRIGSYNLRGHMVHDIVLRVLYDKIQIWPLTSYVSQILLPPTLVGPYVPLYATCKAYFGLSLTSLPSESCVCII